MARRHGWQFPYHAFQVVAITVFLLLSVAFYTFFAPFLAKKLYEYVAVGVYSFLAFSVLILYVRCTGIDPADPGILIGFDEQSAYKSQRDGGSHEETSKIALKIEERIQKHKSTSCSKVGCFLCALLVKEDCRKAEDISQQQADNDEALFCTLCNAEVRKFSEHCRSCDKCVDGFDHHCRWLNNCIGRKNYVTFLSLMGMSLTWLAVECGVGIAVLVRCFTDKMAAEEQITERLGDGFSRIPFAIVVALCTALSLLASVPLAELFFFHMILIRKGITTYEYVVAMRTQSEPPWPTANEEPQSLPSSPMSSAATAISANSLGLQYRGAWCTPPRIFVDHKDEIIPHLEPGRVPSTVDPDNADSSETGKRHAKRPVRISAWKLAKLDSNEAVRAAAKARASSSVLRPVNSRNHYDTDHCSSGNASSRSSTTGIGIPREIRIGTLRSSPLKSSYPPSRASREDPETYPQTPSSLTSHQVTNTLGLPSASEQQASRTRHFNPIYQSPANSPWSVKTNDGNESMASDGAVRAPPKRSSTSSMDNSRSSVYWDQEAGRFVSQNSGRSSRSSGAELLYTGQSIFFGGPLLNEGMVRSLRTAGPSNQRPGGGDRRGSDQLPVFSPRNSQDDHTSRFP